MNSKLNKKLIWLIYCLVPFTVLWLVTLLFLYEEYLPMWHMHRCYFFAWAFIPVAIWYGKEITALFFSVSYIGSVLLVWLFNDVFMQVFEPESNVKANSLILLIWLITAYIFFTSSLIVRGFIRWNRNHRADRIEKRKLIFSLICVIGPIVTVTVLMLFIPSNMIVTTNRLFNETAFVMIPYTVLLTFRNCFYGRRLSYAYCTSLFCVGLTEMILIKCLTYNGLLIIASLPFRIVSIMYFGVFISVFVLIPKAKKSS